MTAILSTMSQMWNIPSRSTELWWLQTMTQAFFMLRSSTLPDMVQSIPNSVDTGLISLAPSFALSTEPGLMRESGMMMSEENMSQV